MGLIVSPTERQQFIDAVRIAREVGWPDHKIAAQLGVPNGKYKNMRQGFEVPSPKHVYRINELLKSSPPKSVLPPAPTGVIDASIQVAEPPAAHPIFIGDDGGAPRMAKQPKEETMETTQVTNGAGKNHKEQEAKPVISRRKGKRGSFLSKAENKRFRTELRDLADQLGSITEVAKRMGVHPSGLSVIASGKGGSTQAKYDLFRKFVDKEKGPGATRTRGMVVRKDGPEKVIVTVGGNGGGGSQRATTHRESLTTEGKLNLYAMAGQLLAAGQAKQAHVLSLVALTSERATLEQITRALAPLAGTG
jgi:hypothetical protein